MKDFFCRFCLFFGLTRFAAWINRNRVVILCYHGVTARTEKSADDPKGLHVRVARFQELSFLKRRYHVIALEEYLEARRKNKPLPPHTAVVTFDDGFRNFLTVAAPLLVSERMPVTLFLITDKLDQPAEAPRLPRWSPDDDKQFLNWQEISELKSQSGISFGSHTRSHGRLTALPQHTAAEELRGSYQLLRERMSMKAGLPLAYPFGFSSKAIAEEAKKAGYKAALTTDEGSNDAAEDLFGLRRVLIGDHDTPAVFAARVSGLLWMMKRFFHGFSGKRFHG